MDQADVLLDIRLYYQSFIKDFSIEKMNCYKLSFLLFSILLFSLNTFSQKMEGVVSGFGRKVLEGASVENKRTGVHVHSNERGKFSVEGRAGDSIKISHVGYYSETIAYRPDTVSISLKLAGLELKDVVITSTLAHLNVISAIDLQTNPVTSSQELLRIVPGLFIGQHAGGGKAEQIFLRGFDIDHGTDINVSVDGMPVNMVSHAHGQGYADLHFLIPETVEKIDFDKGPYNPGRVNLATAGYVEFKTKDRLEYSSVKTEIGKFNTFNMLGMLNLLNREKEAAYIASEYLKTDGYFNASQNFSRINVAGKYTKWLNNEDKLSLGFSHFSSSWDASGQIPERAVLSGTIGHFGAIDSTEGGNTARTNINLEYLKYLSNGSLIKTTAYYSKYNFELYSNFTYFLNDPINGDQIRQKENRDILGYQSELNQPFKVGAFNGNTQIAAGFRNDVIKGIELSHTSNRIHTLENIQSGNINESNLFTYISGDIRKGKWLINPALRLDYFRFTYNDQLSARYSNQSQDKAILSPKLNFMYSPDQKMQFFLKMGKGFHSNDSRVVLAQTSQRILPAAYGADLGMVWKATPRLILNSALWYLYLEQEFVYVGDEGVVEPSGKTARRGIDLGIRYQINDWLFFNSDLTYTRARSIEEGKGENFVPLSVPFTYTAGLSVKRAAGLNGSIRTRHLANRPANEDNSIIAKGYTITDMNVSYQFKRLNLGLVMDNLLNVKWKETQFATESRLANESASVEEIHYTPGTPFNIRGSISFRF